MTMSNYFDQFDGDKPAGGVNFFDQFDESLAGAKPTATDYLKGAASGVGGLVSGIGYLAERAGADQVGGNLRLAGDTAQKAFTKSMTPAGQRAAQSQVVEDDPESGGYRLGDRWGQAFAMGAAQSAPSMVAAALPGGIATMGLRGAAGMAASRGIGGALAPLAAGTAAPVGGWAANVAGNLAARAPGALGFNAAEGAVAGASNAAQWKSDIEQRPEQELDALPGYAQLKAQIGPEAARQQIAEQGAADIMARTTLATGGIGALTGGGALASAFQRMTTGAKGGIAGAIARDAAKEAGQEIPQSGAERAIQNLAKRDYLDPNQSVSQGVVADALSGGAIGGLMGGVTGGASHLAKGPLQKAVEAGSATTPSTDLQTAGIPAGNTQPATDDRGAAARADASVRDLVQAAAELKSDQSPVTALPQPNTLAAPGTPADPVSTAAPSLPANQAEPAGVHVSQLQEGAAPRGNETEITKPTAPGRQAQPASVSGTAGTVGNTGTQPAPTPPGQDVNLQNRDRSRAASVLQMSEIARNPDYLRLGPSRTPDSGAPMVFAVGDDHSRIPETNFGNGDIAVMSDGQRVPFRYAVADASQVEPSHFADGRVNPAFVSSQTGTIKALNNGRTAGLRAAYEIGSAGAYQTELAKDLANVGLSPDVLQRTPNPILVRVYSDSANTAGMAAKSQAQGLGMSPAEFARQDAPLIDSSVLELFQPGDVASAGNRDFVRAFVGKLQQSGQDIAGMMTDAGTLSPMGRQRIQAALMQAAYGEADLVAELFDSIDTDIKAIGEALKAASGAWANMRDSARIGAIAPEVDITGNLVAAVRLIQKARRDGTSLFDLVNQRDIETGETVDDLTAEALRLFYTGKFLTRAVGKEKLVSDLEKYLSLASATSSGADMFGERVEARKLLQAITRDSADEGLQGKRKPAGVPPAGPGSGGAGQGGPGRRSASGGGTATQSGGRGGSQGSGDQEAVIVPPSAPAAEAKPGQNPAAKPETLPAERPDLALRGQTPEEVAAAEAEAKAASDKEAKARQGDAFVETPAAAAPSVEPPRNARELAAKAGETPKAGTHPSGSVQSADEQKPKTALEMHDELMAAVREGKATPDQFKASFDRVVSDKDAIIASLSSKTKVQLLDEMYGWMRQRYANEPKAVVVEAVYSDMIGEYSLGNTISFGMGRGSYEAAVREMVEATDADRLEQYRAERQAAIDDAIEKRKAKAAALESPQTLDDFNLLMNERMRSGQTRKDAFLSLSPKQRIQYDELAAESTREAREARKRAQKTAVQSAAQTTGGAIVETKHTKTGVDLYVVQLADRLSTDDYKTVLGGAKKLGGWYSAFRGGGAVPGFQFKTREDAAAFLKLLGGDTADALAQAEKRRDAFDDDRSQSAVERLREMADKIESSAQEALSRDRKTNTARRARFAASAERSAEAERALAKTMRNIASAIAEGKAKFLDAVRTRSQVDALTSYVRTAKYNELRVKYPDYGDQEKRRGEPPTAETADFAEFPSFAAYRSDLAMLARQMLEVEGTKKLGAQLMKVAEDVTDAYIAFAKAPGNLYKLSAFGISRGDDVKTAIFPSRDMAERAIKRSGLTGKAIVLAEKRGVNRIILSPSEAINRRIWDGDNDKRITLTVNFGNELVDAVGRRGNQQNKLSVPWQFQTAYDRRKALSRMGVETASEFRSALREFIALQERAVANKIREMELAMVGRKNDGLDFFPTPQNVADEMVEAAGVTQDMAVLEPSAGMGHIADRIRAAGVEPDVIELAPDRRQLLSEKGYNVLDVDDFLRLKPREFFTFGDVFRSPDGTEGVMRGSGGMGSGRVGLRSEAGEFIGWFNREELTGVRHRAGMSGYDRIIMNPPFSNRRDANHVQHAYSLLKPGGRVVAIVGEGVFFGQDKVAQAFREWLDEVGGTAEKLPEGSFTDPSLPVNTGVNARMVVIDKPDGGPVTEQSADERDGETRYNTASAGPAISPSDRAVYDMAAEGKPASEILAFLSKASRRPFNRVLATALQKAGLQTGVTVDSQGGWSVGNRSYAQRYAAAYSPRSDAVALFTPREAERHLLHELVHAATLKAIESGGVSAMRMRALFNHVQKSGKLDGQYGMTSLDEFVAEAFSNPQFQEALRSVPAPAGSTLKSAWQWFVRIVARIIGLKTRPSETALDRALRDGLALMEENAAILAADEAVRFNLDTEDQFADTERKIGGRTAYDKAKAAGQTKLGYHQWVQVRTPAFKAWFGDWEAHANNTLVNDQIEKWKQGNLPSGAIIQIGHPGSILQQFGFPDAPMHLTQRVLTKAVKQKHEVGLGDLRDLAMNIQAPLAIFNSKSGPDHRVVVTEARHEDGNIVVAMDIQATRNGVEINDIRSIHPKRDSSIANWIDDGLLIGLEKGKGREWLENSAGSNSQQSQVNATSDEPILYDASGIRNVSKVVDENGEPMVVYHWTDKQFNEFRPSSLSGGLLYFGETSKDAKDGARGKKVEMQVYVRMKSPLNAKDAPMPWHKAESAGGGRLYGNALTDSPENDGLYVKDESGVAIAVTDPAQIKSATGNVGTFDAADPDIRFNVSGTRTAVTPPPSPGNLWQSAKAKAAALLAPGRIDKLIYELQDKYVDLRRIRDHIRSIGGTITDLNDAYLGEELYHKRLAHRTQDFLKAELRPLLADMKARSVGMEELESFLHARHAPEANAEMAKRNPNQAEIDAGRRKAAAVVHQLERNLQTAQASGLATMAIEQALNDARGDLVKWNGAQAFSGSEQERRSLSGMTDQAAAAIMAGLTPERRADLDALAAKVDAINSGTLQLLDDYGLMSKASLNEWRNKYQHYIPLHRDEAHPDSANHPIGQGFSVKGDAAKRRTGSNQKVTHILGHIAMQREAALTRGEKNRVMLKLYLMARQNPLPDVWKVGAVPLLDTIDQATGFVKSVPDPLYRTRPNVVTLRLAGKDVAITMNEHNPQALRMAQSLKNLDVDDLHYLIPIVGRVTRWFAAMNTQYNPIFGIINLMRDTQGAALNLSTTELAGKQGQIFKDQMSILGGVLKNKGRMPTTGPWAALFEEFNAVGGTTGYRDLYLHAEDRAKTLLNELKALDRGQTSKAAHAVSDWLSDYNEAMENATRLAAYKAALDHGLSKERAASLAKNLTVNFNRKGRQTRELGAFYAFLNASIQGTTRMAQTLTGPAGRKIMAGGVALGALSTMLGIAMMGGGDDDEWSKIPEFVKERALIIPIGRDKYLTIPMTLGFHFLPNIGRLAVEMAVYKTKTAGRQMASLFTVLADAFNPLGGSAPIAQIAAPTVLDPVAALLQNKDWTGKPIYLENRNSLDPKPGTQRAKDSATPLAKWFAEAINAVTGGTEYTPGGWSPTPDQIDYVIGQLTGGVGREAGKVAATAAAPFTGEELPPYKIPLIGRLYGSTSGASGQSEAFYENIRQANAAESEIKGRLKDGGGIADFLKENPHALELAALGNAAERQVRELRGIRRGIMSRGEPEAASRAREVNERMAAVMRGFNKQAERMQ